MSRTIAAKSPSNAAGALRPLAGVGAWAGAFIGSYVLGFAVLAGVGVPSGTAPMLSGAVTAALFYQVGRRRKLARFPGRIHTRSLTKLARGLAEATDAEQVASLVIGQIRQAAGTERVYLWLPSREQRDFHLASGLGPDPGDAALPEPWLAAYFKPRDRDEHGREIPTPLDGWLEARGMNGCAPIHAHGRMLGLLTYGRKPGAPFLTEGDRWLIDQALAQAGLALAYVGLQKVERKRRSKLDNLTHLYKLAQKRAITDGLTGLNTHVYFKEQLAKRFSEARRHRGTLGVALVDIDHFKRINDSYGHPMGDEVLRRVSAAVKQISRVDDTVARYGGEELSLVLPQTDLTGALALAERIRESVEALELYDSKGRCLPPITVSVGVAVLEPSDRDAAHVIERADQALYAAKRGGRNQVCKAS